MPPPGSFERRLLLVLLLFSLVPSLLLVAAGTYLLSETVALHASAATFERIAESGRALLAAVESSGDPAVVAAAERHREVLSGSLVQSGRWEYLNERVLRLIPVLSLVLAAVLVWLAVRSARGIAREMTRPIRELVGWAGRIAREEPLPSAPEGEPSRPDEFAALRQAFRSMAGELEISRQRALEAERARTWVVMARSVAHELKNSLTPLRLGVRSLEGRLREDPDGREALEVLSSEAARLEEMARAFAQFGRLPEGAPSEVDLRELLDYLLRTHFPEDVRHRLGAPDDIPRVIGYHDALSRAFSNLLLNAVEAMGGAGEVEVRIAPAEPGFLEVRIRDTGPGIAEADLDRIWEPDFTTKSRGTGLGLALVKQTIAAHGGRVTADRPAGGGAEFRVLLPIREPS